jgi:SAM-dependent methyltransferase
MPGNPPSPSIDVDAFWQTHDGTLAQDITPSESVLSHDLYRGMPEWFNAYFDHFQSRVIRSYLAKCKSGNAVRAMDLGCGTGRWVALLSARGYEVFGVDVGERTLQYAAHRFPRAHFCCQRLPDLSFEENSFDVLISVTVLQHIPHERQQESLREIRRVLKPAAHLLLCESVDMGDRSSHIFANSRRRWLEVLAASGFSVVAQTSCEFLPYVKLFHWVQSRRTRSEMPSYSEVTVSYIAQLLRKQPLLAGLVRLAVMFSYPMEHLASATFPADWARLACFLLKAC